MSRPYSNDLRERVVSAVESGRMSRNQAAQHYGVAISTAVHLVRRFRESGSSGQRKMRSHKPKSILRAHNEWLVERVQARDFTLKVLVGELVERGLKVDIRAVWEFVHAQNLTFKKNAGGWRAGSPGRGAKASAMG